MPTPTVADVQLHAYVPAAALIRLDELAARLGQKRSALVRSLIMRELAEAFDDPDQPGSLR